MMEVVFFVKHQNKLLEDNIILHKSKNYMINSKATRNATFYLSCLLQIEPYENLYAIIMKGGGLLMICRKTMRKIYNS